MNKFPFHNSSQSTLLTRECKIFVDSHLEGKRGLGNIPFVVFYVSSLASDWATHFVPKSTDKKDNLRPRKFVATDMNKRSLQEQQNKNQFLCKL